jgi:hypothetical protein
VTLKKKSLKKKKNKKRKIKKLNKCYTGKIVFPLFFFHASFIFTHHFATIHLRAMIEHSRQEKREKSR